MRDVLVRAGSDGQWSVHKSDNISHFQAGVWRDAPQEKRVRRSGFLGWLGFTKRVPEAPNGRIDSNEVRPLQLQKLEGKYDNFHRDVPLPPEIQPKAWRARHYEVRLQFQPDGGVKGNTKVLGEAKRDAKELTFDLGNFPTATYVYEADKKVGHSHKSGQLTVSKDVKEGQEFFLSLGYEGKPTPDSHPAIPADLGWLQSKNSIVTLNGVENASTWMATDNDPSNKATYDFHLDVPKGHFALANGKLVDVKETKSGRKFHYKTSTPMASHLASVNVFEEKDFATTVVGKDMEVVHPKGLEKAVEAGFSRHDEMMGFLTERLGAYPFESYGAIVADLPVDERTFNMTDGERDFEIREKKFHIAFEAQTRPIYAVSELTGSGSFERTHLHETAHQWFGNSVGKASERDIWVAEAFPSYTNLLWLEKNQGAEAYESAVKSMHDQLKEHTFTDTMASPDRDKIFSEQNYQRMTLSMHALRKTLGEEQFFATLRGTLSELKDKSVSSEQMAQTMDKLNGGTLKPFFQDWLHSKSVPDLEQI